MGSEAEYFQFQCRYVFCTSILPSLNILSVSRLPGELATFVQRLPNVFQTPWAFGTRWEVVEQTSLVLRSGKKLDVWNMLGSRCTNVSG